jgi:hypothetical protein
MKINTIKMKNKQGIEQSPARMPVENENLTFKDGFS